VFEVQRVACGSEDLTLYTMSTGSLIPILVRHVTRGEMGAVSPPIPKIDLKFFRSNKAFDVKAEKNIQCKSKQQLEEFILLQLLVEPDQSNMVFQLPMVN